MAQFGVPGQNVNPLAYADFHLSTVPVVNAPRRPTTSDKKFPMWTEWRVNRHASAPAEEGEFWKLIRFDSSGNAIWVKITPGDHGPLLSVETDDGAPNVVPDSDGELQILGTNGVSVTGQGPGNTVTIALDGGGQAIDQINVNRADGGTDPVLPDADGEITVIGSAVDAHGTPIETVSRSANAYNIEVQTATTASTQPADKDDAGLISANSNQFTISSNGWLSYKSSQAPGYSNLGISIDSNILTVHDAQGNALSSSNPAYVTLNSKTAGQLVTVAVTANQTMNANGAAGGSDIVDQLFGLTSGDNWGSTTSGINNNNIPFWLYACLNDDEDHITFGIMRIPQKKLAPDPPYIGTPSTTMTSVQDGLYLFEDVTIGDYDKNPILVLGFFSMTFQQPGGADDWTLTPLGTSQGLGRIFPGLRFNMPQGVFGAASGSWMLPNSGTAPTFSAPSNARYQYSILPSGRCFCYFTMTGSGATVGAGAVDAQLIMPFRNDNTMTYEMGVTRVQAASYHVGANIQTQIDKNYSKLIRLDDGSAVQYADFASGTRTLSGSFNFPIYQPN